MNNFRKLTLIGTLLLGVWFVFKPAPSHQSLPFPSGRTYKTNSTAGFAGTVRLVDYTAHISCSGFIIDAHFAITAAHCLNSHGKLTKDTITVYADHSLFSVESRALAIDLNTDMGLIYGDFRAFTPLDFEPYNEFIKTNPHVACGYPRGQRTLACNEFVFETMYYDYLLGKAQTHHGMSGGPVVDMITGKATAIISAIDESGNSHVVPLQGIFGIFPDLE